MALTPEATVPGSKAGIFRFDAEIEVRGPADAGRTPRGLMAEFVAALVSGRPPETNCQDNIKSRR